METKRALIYARVSSDRQAKEGHGLDAQEHRCRKYAQGKGYQVEAVFSDTYTGGGDFAQRPAVKKMLTHIEKRAHVSFVMIVDDVKRFARDVVGHWAFRAALKNMGVTLECPNFEFKEDSEEAWMHEAMTSVFNEYERRTNRRQVVQKQKARLEKGYWPFYAPSGYVHVKNSVHGKILVRDEPTASLLQQALEKYASGELFEQMDVVKFLNQSGYNRGRLGGKVYVGTITRILQKKMYAGYIEYLPWEVEMRKGQHEGLVSLETFNKIQDRLHGRIRMKLRKDMREDFPLRGFITCGECGHRVTASISRGSSGLHPYYRCGQKGCSRYGKSLRKDVVETEFQTLLKTFSPRPQVVELAKAIVKRVWEERIKDHVKGIEIKRRRISAIGDEIEALLNRAARASDSVAQKYEAKIQELVQEESQLKQEVEASATSKIDFGTAFDKVSEFIKSPYFYWQKGGLNDKRLVLRLVFAEDLSYHPQKGFGTAKVSPILKLFAEIGAANSQDVEVRRVELRSESGSESESTTRSSD